MTENPVPKPVEQIVEERETVQAIGEPGLTENPSKVVSRTTQVSAPDKGVNILGIIGFLLAIVALFFYNIYAIPGIIAVIISSIALSQIAHEGQAGRGFATWGVLLGALSILWVILQYFGVVQSDGMLLAFLQTQFGFTR
ncbi:MAG: DUF4190 domain-containing protein [Anaerolineaceae bacterium]|mgnify:CR=1 FL=1|jgi:hypothetical protein|nr:DUF4190 domain-containing protein [Anaerolineaceae bacterium]MDD4043164.1 DUF4190 domain-containing protein [Anaerolineaceae bacterium]MDD4577635.1 DUF4190 domain-containing protein [Anaerolineaceae bacterium]